MKKITGKEIMEIAKKAVDYIVQDDSNLQCSKEDLYQEAC